MKTRLGWLVPLLLTAAAASAEDALKIQGLREPVEILRDRWGIAHIYAQNEEDLFFAQGWNAARDRLFQLELWRRQATGTAAEILGRRELQRDVGARLHRFRGDLRTELKHYHPRGEVIVNAFVRGINAYVAAALRDPERLPLEFQLLGIQPGLWTPEVVISRHQGLLDNVVTELSLGRAVHLLGASKVRELHWFRPGEPALDLDPAINGELLSSNILQTYDAFRESLKFKPEDVIPEHRGAPLAAEVSPDEAHLMRRGEHIGSNNWVVAGSRTLTGFPLMANDPHRAHSTPSLRYWVHLVAPGWNVIGGGEPALPGVSIGHNEFGAWGLTIFGQDSEDLYVYDTNPANPNEYRYRGGWEAMTVLEESIAVKGETAHVVQLKYTRHGPVLFEDRDHRKAYALRAAWLDTGAAPYLASLRMDQARSWEEFREACSYSRIPAENMVWADRQKNIGYQAVGVSPIRKHWSGLVPVPGDGRYEWEGYLPIKALPHIANPAKGFFATANNYLVPDGYPHVEALHYMWGNEMRAARIEELLGGGFRHTLADMLRFQHDELAIPARNLVPFLREIAFDDARIRRARDLLLDWDFVLDKASVPAAIYVVFERRLSENVRDVLLPEGARDLIDGLNVKKLIDWVAAPDGRFGADPVAGRDALIAKSLTEAVEELTRRLGADMTAWTYGQPKLKHVLIRHPLAAAVKRETAAKLNVGPVPRGGYAATVNNTSSDDNQTSGASFRIVVDLADWDNAVGINAPGQSGDPDGAHYRDLFELWARGKYVPVFYGRAKVESVTEAKLRLEP